MLCYVSCVILKMDDYDDDDDDDDDDDNISVRAVSSHNIELLAKLID